MNSILKLEPLIPDSKGTVQYAPLRTLAADFLIHMGIMEKPS